MILSAMLPDDLSHLAYAIREVPKDAHVAVYARVSDPNQLSGHGITRQIEEGTKVAHALGRRDFQTIKDEGKSAYFGANVTHGNLGRYIADAPTFPNGSILIVEDVDRLSRQRSTKFGKIFMTMLEDGVTFVFYAMGNLVINSDNIDRNPYLIALVFGKQAAGHHESHKKLYRLGLRWVNKRQNAADASPGTYEKPFVPITRRCPGWLRWEEFDRKSGTGLFVPIPERVEIVQRIFTDLANGLGRDSIARCLNAAGHLPWGTGVHWHGGTVQKITENRAVLGEMQMHTAVENPKHPGDRKLALRKPVGEPIQGYYPAVIAPELWRAARAVSDKRRPVKVSNTGGRNGTKCGNLFAKMAVCWACGGPMVRRDPQKRGEPKYKCRWSTEAKCKSNTTYSYLKVEAGLLRWARDYAPSIAKPEETKRLESEIAALLNRIDSQKARRRKLFERFGDDDDPQAAEIIDQLKVEIVDLEQQLLRAQHELDRTRTTELVHRTLIDEMTAKLAAATTDEEKGAIRVAVRESLKEFIRSIRFFPDHISIHLLPNVWLRTDLEANPQKYSCALFNSEDIDASVDYNSMDGAAPGLNRDEVEQRTRIGRRIFSIAARSTATISSDLAHFVAHGMDPKIDN